MNKDQVDLILNKFQKRISKKNLKELQEKLLGVPEEKSKEIEEIKVKSTVFTVILSTFLGLFGVGSFYLGKIKLGIIKLVCNIILPLAIGLIFLYWLSPLNEDYCKQAEAIKIAITEETSFNYSLSDLNTVASNFSTANKNYKDELSKENYDEDKLSEYYKIMQEQSVIFVTYKAYFSNLAENLSDEISVAVDNRTSFKVTLSTVLTNMNFIDSATDLAKVQSEIDNTVSELTELLNRASSAYQDYSFNYRFLRMFFTVMIIIDGIIIVAYWISEIFREREMCYQLNYEKIKKSIN